MAVKLRKRVSILCFHDELCQVYNALMTALALLRAGSEVTILQGTELPACRRSRST